MTQPLPPLRVILIRHGQTDHNKAGIIQGQTDIPLNDEGRKQARECGSKIRSVLSGSARSVPPGSSSNGADRPTPGGDSGWNASSPFSGPISAVYTSDLKRCVETTEILLEASGLDTKPVRTPLLRERFMGELENRPAAEGRQRCREENRHWDSFGESNTHMVQRLSKQWDTIVSRGLAEQQGTVLVVTHGGCITRFTNYLVNEVGEPFALGEHVTEATLRSPQNTSFTVFDVDRNTFQGTLQVFADVGHLDGVEKRVFNADESVPGRW
ncbi:hypothetical protein CJU89_5783 [Yarrowia sp. B02]|nr:hypothetical protein CJU89_5783 [Yarrowia sp. B02]